ncbi:MAG: 50S ribosomal protein L25 [Candidatus Wallbacteria bacterium]|nr:50S ribosomal protein L25 [Candidatus Wallbacteria bacterium]
MEQLKCQHRDQTGKNANTRLRSAGFLPAIIYGKLNENIPVKLKLSDYLKFKNLTHNKKIIELAYLGPDGKEETKTVIIKDYDIDPIKKSLIHFDFYEFDPKELLRFNIPIRYIGMPIGVKQGGILQKEFDQIEIECYPRDAVDFIELDVTNLNFHDSIRIKDLAISDKIKILEDLDAMVATVAAPVEEKTPEPVEGEIVEEAKEPEVIKKGKEKTEEEEEKA